MLEFLQFEGRVGVVDVARRTKQVLILEADCCVGDEGRSLHFVCTTNEGNPWGDELNCEGWWFLEEMRQTVYGKAFGGAAKEQSIEQTISRM